MRVHYTGRKAEITDAQKRKLASKFEKCHKILGKRRSLEAHVVLSRQRHLCEAEVTLRALNHTLVVSASGADPFSAVQGAADKMERQVIRNKHKLIDVSRPERQRGEPSPVAGALMAEADREARNHAKANSSAPARVIRAEGITPKPMTVEGAMLKINETGRDQVTYRDAESGELRVLLRRRDGNFELIEAG